MRKISIFIISIFILSSCGKNVQDTIRTFNTKAEIVIYDRIFLSEINESQLLIQSDSFDVPVIFRENTVQYEDFSVELSPKENSVFYLPELILSILNDRKNTGVYNGIKYYCEFKNNTALSELEWGEVLVYFDYFK